MNGTGSTPAPGTATLTMVAGRTCLRRLIPPPRLAIEPMAAPKKNNGDNKGIPDTVPGPRGGRLRTGGTPGNKGGTGRPPNEFMQHMRSLATLPEAEAYTLRCIKGEFGPRFHIEAMKWAADRGYGKAAQSITEYEFNPDDFSEAGLERVADGEDPVHVLASGGRVQRNA